VDNPRYEGLLVIDANMILGVNAPFFTFAGREVSGKLPVVRMIPDKDAIEFVTCECRDEPSPSESRLARNAANWRNAKEIMLKVALVTPSNRDFSACDVHNFGSMINIIRI
jgi:hypothetical protein